MKKGLFFSIFAVAILASCATEPAETVEETVVDTTAVVDSVALEDEVVEGTSEEVKPEVE
jgi:hypothetical protein